MQACLTLDLEPDHAGRAAPRYDGWQPARVAELLALLRRYHAPLTVFAVGVSLRAQPATIALLRDAGAEFHLHSHSHDLQNPDSLDEIRAGKAAFRAVFGRAPEGYRAPEGRISVEGWRRLESEGFSFDSSIFPSFWPRPRYLRFRPAPFRPLGTSLLELPISTLTPARLICSLSFFKLLGWGLYRPLLEKGALPEPLVFDMHLHDLWPLPAFDELPRHWRFVYSRNHGRGMALLEAFLDVLARRGYSFTTLGSVARERLAA
jgi:peptidoglycan/xylan/chitin deacetylase (PgdA/CDA1 family)